MDSGVESMEEATRADIESKEQELAQQRKQRDLELQQQQQQTEMKMELQNQKDALELAEMERQAKSVPKMTKKNLWIEPLGKAAFPT